MPFPQLPALSRQLTSGMFSTITSPVFSEFVLELGKLPSQFSRSSWEHWGHWGHVDNIFGERFAGRGDFSLIVRTGKLYDRETFQLHAQERFPSLVEKGCIRFETSHSIDGYWR